MCELGKNIVYHMNCMYQTDQHLVEAHWFQTYSHLSHLAVVLAQSYCIINLFNAYGLGPRPLAIAYVYMYFYQMGYHDIVLYTGYLYVLTKIFLNLYVMTKIFWKD